MPSARRLQPSRDPSPSTEHYLRAILELREERGYARVVDIATRVGVTKGTVSLALGQLEQRGLLRFDPAHFPLLTPAGRRVAADVRGRYTIALTFLTEVLGLPPERASAEACRWEHVISHDAADRLLDLLRFAGHGGRLGEGLEEFRAFHRSCSAGSPCASCAVRGPIEAYCPTNDPIPLPPHKPRP